MAESEERELRTGIDLSLRTIKQCPQCKLELSDSLSECPLDGSALTDVSADTIAMPPQYEFISVIGSGGMSIVYQAKHQLMDKIVAVKMLSTKQASPNSMMRLQQEAKAISRLNHPNIIAVHDFGVMSSGQPYMVMDLVKGQTLAQRLKSQGQMDPKDCLPIFTQICDALIHAHDNGILHRDLKPSNIMLVGTAGSDMQVKLLDFGIAKFMQEQRTLEITRTGDVIGSPLYMSPEQANGTNLDVRSDIYALGCVIYECLTGNPPHLGDSVIATLMKQLNEPTLSLKEATLGKEFPQWLEAVVQKALAKGPEQRFQTVADLKNALVQEKFETPAPIDKKVSPAKERTPIVIAGGIVGALLALFLVCAFAPWSTNKDQSQSSDSKHSTESPLPVGSNAELERFATLPLERRPTKFDLKYYAEITPAGLHALQQLPDLREVSVDDASGELADAVLFNIRGLPVETLNVANSGISDEGLENVSTLTNLSKLHAEHATKLTDAGLKAFEKLRRLHEVDLAACKNITGDGVVYLAQDPVLDTLNLKETSFTDRNAPKLAKLKALQKLYLSQTELTDRGLSSICCLQQLRVLNLNDDNITDAELANISHMRNLEALSMMHTHVTDAGLRYLTALKNLQFLNISNNPQISAHAVEELRKSLPACDIKHQKDALPTEMERGMPQRYGAIGPSARLPAA
jgi:serine/threonine protein kinase